MNSKKSFTAKDLPILVGVLGIISVIVALGIDNNNRTMDEMNRGMREAAEAVQRWDAQHNKPRPDGTYSSCPSWANCVYILPKDSKDK